MDCLNQTSSQFHNNILLSMPNILYTHFLQSGTKIKEEFTKSLTKVWA